LPNKSLFQNVYALSQYGSVHRTVERRKPVAGDNVTLSHTVAGDNAVAGDYNNPPPTSP